VAAAAALVLPCLYAATTAVVLAHAQYSGSTPAANATVSAAPSSVQITYTQELSDIHASIKGPDGSEVTTAAAKFDLENRHNASVPTRDAGPGLYTVTWHNVSGDDGDPNDGTFVFTVAGPAPAPTAPPAATPAPMPPPTTATQAGPTTAAPTCIDNGRRTPGINDVRVDTYCKRQALRDKYAGQIDVATFNAALADGEGFESALSDAMADFQAEQRAAKKH
jgi:methionine-rich copper-binding protein CopC